MKLIRLAIIVGCSIALTACGGASVSSSSGGIDATSLAVETGILGFSGNAQPLWQIDVQNSDNITISNLVGVAKSSSFTTLRDLFEGTTTQISGSKSVGILKRGVAGF